jgi:hypothetical protein
VLYQLVARVRPFEAPTDLEVLLRVQKADFKPAREAAPDLPREVSDIIDRAMQLEPDMRYQGAEEMLTDIENVLRTVFRPVGQTELKKWLAALGARDGLPPMSKASNTPTPGRPPGTGEMEGKDVVLSDMGDVDGEEATSLASFDGPGGEMRPRLTRQRAAELPLPVPEDDEAALSGRHSPLEFPLPLPETEERPGRRRARRSGGFSALLVGLVVLGGAAFAGRYFGLLREKESTTGDPPAASAPPAEGDKAAVANAPNAPDKTAPGAVRAGAVAAARKPDEPEPTHESVHHVHATPDKADKGDKAEKSEHARRIDELKGMMAPDPSLDPAPAPSEPAPTPPPAPTAPPSTETP